MGMPCARLTGVITPSISGDQIHHKTWPAFLGYRCELKYRTIAVPGVAHSREGFVRIRAVRGNGMTDLAVRVTLRPVWSRAAGLIRLGIGEETRLSGQKT